MQQLRKGSTVHVLYLYVLRLQRMYQTRQILWC
uniref:Uncharacterized protein n=1 Tax=Arundo donax TaxID=35708 RepID=A0A0A9H7W9_ARUDO